MTQERVCRCERCGRRITRGEYEMRDGMCQECYEIEIDDEMEMDDLDYEDDYGQIQDVARAEKELVGTQKVRRRFERQAPSCPTNEAST